MSKATFRATWFWLNSNKWLVTVAWEKRFSTGIIAKFCSVLADSSYANVYILLFSGAVIMKRKANMLDDCDRLFLVICNSIRQ